MGAGDIRVCGHVLRSRHGVCPVTKRSCRASARPIHEEVWRRGLVGLEAAKGQALRVGVHRPEEMGGWWTCSADSALPGTGGCGSAGTSPTGVWPWPAHPAEVLPVRAVPALAPAAFHAPRGSAATQSRMLAGCGRRGRLFTGSRLPDAPQAAQVDAFGAGAVQVQDSREGPSWHSSRVGGTRPLDFDQPGAGLSAGKSRFSGQPRSNAARIGRRHVKGEIAKHLEGTQVGKSYRANHLAEAHLALPGSLSRLPKISIVRRRQASDVLSPPMLRSRAFLLRVEGRLDATRSRAKARSDTETQARGLRPRARCSL